MSKMTSVLSLSDLQLLKAIIACDLRDQKDIAAACGISRPYLTNCLSGDRFLSGEYIAKILSELNIRNWVLDPKIVHLFKVHADLSNLAIIVNRFIKRPIIRPLNLTNEVGESEPYVGYFLISDSEDVLVGSAPKAPYMIVYHNHYYIGRGKKDWIKPEEAPAFLPTAFNNAHWAKQRRENRVEDVAVINAKLEDIFKERKKVFVEDINSIIHATAEITWQDVIDNAISFELTPAQVFKLINDSIPPQEENPDPGYGH